jgi:phosphohistidine phosphatase
MLAFVVSRERRLVLLRHAKSDWSTGHPDEHRPLAARGRRDAPAAGRWLRKHAGPIDLVVCSTATRARQTWNLASSELDRPPPVRHDERVYGANAAELLRLVQELPDDSHSVLIVGHNPGMADLVSLLTHQDHAMKTSSIAVLTWHGTWAESGPSTARLAEAATPRAGHPVRE